ncbi:hypothetical protein ACFLUH_00880 [Chloroflexota bacterium]
MKLNRVPIIICLAATAVISGACSEEKTVDSMEFLTYSNEAITFKYPDWPDVAPEEDEIFLLKTNGTEVFSAARYPVPSTLMKRELEQNIGAVFDGEYAYHKLGTGSSALNAVTRLLYSDYETYTLTIAGQETPDASLLDTAECKTRELNTRDKVGIMPVPAYGDASLLTSACREARSLGAEVISWYFFWSGLADDWAVADYVMEGLSHEGKSVVVMNVIHTNVLGEYPPEFESFTDPGFKEGFAEFSVDFVDRYQPDYYFIGGEVDIYLNEHRDEIQAFQEVLSYAYHAIKSASPETQVGLVVTYHYARDNGAIDIIQTLAPECDIIGYTVHPHLENFSYRDISRGLEYLNEVPGVVPDMPFAILETCWSSSVLLESSEELQAEFVHDFFSFVDSGGAEFVIWFSLHDQDDCSEAARTHLEPLPHLLEDEQYIRFFKEFMCSPGLKNTDGSPKQAWYVWQQYIEPLN